jgi:hypothetical protein
VRQERVRIYRCKSAACPETEASVGPHRIDPQQDAGMDPIDRPSWLGLLSLTAHNDPDGAGTRRGRHKRNPWVVVAFFLLIGLAWIGSQP